MREAGIEPDRQNEKAEAVRPDASKPHRSGSVEKRLALLRTTEPGGYDNACPRAPKAAMRPGMVCGGVAITTRSGASGSYAASE
jgi:hypothetical protein